MAALACSFHRCSFFHHTNHRSLSSNRKSSLLPLLAQSNRPPQRRSLPKEQEKLALAEPRRASSEWRKKKNNSNNNKKTKKNGEESYYSQRQHSSSAFGRDQIARSASSSSTALPSPPAGFILDEEGHVVMMSPPSKRVVTLVDPANARPLECLIRRVFSTSQGIQCFLMCPLDTPLQILKIDEDEEGVTELSDEELEEALPTAAYELAKRRLHLVLSGFCLTARGGFCFTEEEIINLDTEYGQGVGGSLSEGVEIGSFRLRDKELLIYTPFDSLLFVAFKDEATGELKIAEDDLLDDEAVLDAIDEEEEYQVLMEEEVVLNETLREATSASMT